MDCSSAIAHIGCLEAPSSPHYGRQYLRCGDIELKSAGRFPEPRDLTADFVYARLHGDEELYVSSYSDPALDRWASRFREWSARRDVYVYFDNTMRGAAPFDALALAERLG